MTSTSPAPPASSEKSFVAGAVQAVKHKGLRYSAVSVVNVLVGQGLLLLFNVFVFHVNDLSEADKIRLTTWSNILAVCISAIPAYYMSRTWVWGKKGRSHFKKEVLPFWVFVAIGLVFSTVVVRWSTDYFHGTFSGTTAALLPNVMNITAFGILWILRFFLFDKMFHVEIHEDDTPDED